MNVPSTTREAPAVTTSVFIPAFAGYEERVRQSFARQGAMTLIGAAVAEGAPGYCAPRRCHCAAVSTSRRPGPPV